MGRKIYLEVEIDWDDYDDVCDELILEDSGILDAIKDGVQVKLFAIPRVIKSVCEHDVRNLKDRQECKKCGEVWIRQ